MRKVGALSLIFIDFYVPTLTPEAGLDRSVKLLLTFASIVIPGFNLFAIHGQDFYSLPRHVRASTREGVGVSM
jgi:hypothetical protein